MQDTGTDTQRLKSAAYVDQPQFIIKKGKVLDTQQEFVGFKRGNITRWGAIQQVIHALEKYLGQFSVTFAHIDCLKVLYFSE